MFWDEEIANVTTAAIRALGRPPPEEDPALRVVALRGVRRAREPGMTPERHHDAWVRDMLSVGWRLGRARDPGERTHPNLVPFAALPPGEQFKDVLGLAIARTMLAWEAP
jgi:hypothetical protein